MILTAVLREEPPHMSTRYFTMVVLASFNIGTVARYRVPLRYRLLHRLKRIKLVNFPLYHTLQRGRESQPLRSEGGVVSCPTALQTTDSRFYPFDVVPIHWDLLRAKPDFQLYPLLSSL